MIDLKSNAEKFMSELPYHNEPYCGRNWGHSWHSMCSYHGKLKPAIAHYLIRNFTKKDDVVFDPMCGVGTIPFEAALQGRISIGNDLSSLAYFVTKSKIECPSLLSSQIELQNFEDFIAKEITTIQFNNAPYRDFGLNHSLKEYFHPQTFIELLAARKYIKVCSRNLTAEQALIISCLLHVLHGNRPYALSRRSHPLTPYAPSGEYIYKSVAKHVKDKMERVYRDDNFAQFVKGKSLHADFRECDGIMADVIITSPPFADSMKFYTQNWMRLWMCGWEPIDFKNVDARFVDNEQNKNMDVYIDFFDMCNRNLKSNGFVILHLGMTKKINMALELVKRADKYFEKVYLGTETVSAVEKHGIKDKGGTIAHQFLFLRKK